MIRIRMLEPKVIAETRKLAGRRNSTKPLERRPMGRATANGISRIEIAQAGRKAS